MSISPGTRFGSYEIVEPIGSGGMGEVYRSRDTALGRDVALKVLPASFSNDAMRVARFEEEAKTLASLNHANIAHIYGLERADGSTGIIGKDKVVRPLLDLTENVSEPSLSPNGQWLLYYEFRNPAAADAEIDIRPFPDVRQQRRPVGPGIHPVFSADGSEIFFFDHQGLSVAPVQYSPFRVGNARKLFRGEFWYGVAGPTGALGRAWDVDSKNDRFLMITMPKADAAGGPAGQLEIDVVLNWLEELRQRVPKH